MVREIIKPIIVFGTGRSGTTVFQRMLSEHPGLAWLSVLCDRFPGKPILNYLLMQSLDFPVAERIVRMRFRSGEFYKFWDYYAPGVRNTHRDLVASDVSNKTKNAIREVMSKMVTGKRGRLLLKITGWPRIGYLNEVFPDGKFIHVIRDGRAVANSLLNVYFWRGWEGPENWRSGPLSESHEQEWEDHNRSFVVLAGIQWKILMDAAEIAVKDLEPSRVMEVKYEDLCRDHLAVFKEVTEFCEIDWSDRFEAGLRKYQLKNMNFKYEQDLTPQQKKDLNDSLEAYLMKYGYL